MQQTTTLMLPGFIKRKLKSLKIKNDSITISKKKFFFLHFDFVIRVKRRL